MVNYLFDNHDIHRLYANMDARNLTSKKICEKLNMRQEAHFIQDFWNKGEWTDSLIFGLLCDEYYKQTNPLLTAIYQFKPTTRHIMTIITHTPIWVWAVLALLIYLGILQRKNRPIQRWRLLIMPAIFLPLSLITLSTSPNINLSIITFVLAMMVSFGVAKYHF